MDKLLVVVGSIGVIGALIWWFFGQAQSEAVSATGTAKLQTVEITVDGGYSPRVVALKQGVPAKLIFFRKDPSGCLEEVVLPDFGVSQRLPINKSQEISILPEKAGEFKYTCGMQMFSGTVVVK